jgi:hypothetical protein
MCIVESGTAPQTKFERAALHSTPCFWLQIDSRIGLFYRVCAWLSMDSIMFVACLKHKALGFDFGEHKGVNTI